MNGTSRLRSKEWTLILIICSALSLSQQALAFGSNEPSASSVCATEEIKNEYCQVCRDTKGENPVKKSCVDKIVLKNDGDQVCVSTANKSNLSREPFHCIPKIVITTSPTEVCKSEVQKETGKRTAFSCIPKTLVIDRGLQVCSSKADEKTAERLAEHCTNKQIVNTASNSIERGKNFIQNNAQAQKICDETCGKSVDGFSQWNGHWTYDNPLEDQAHFSQCGCAQSLK